MEYENIRMPELKSLARDRGLRNYSRMRKTELVAFLAIWVGIGSLLCEAKPPSGAKPGSPIKLV